MSDCTCSSVPDVVVDLEKDAVIGAFVAVKVCGDCGGEVSRAILGTGSRSKYEEMSESELLSFF